MVKNKDRYETISIDLNPELIRLLNSKTKDIENDHDGSGILQSCIRTGLQLGEINTIFRKKMIEESAFQKQLVEAYGDRERSAEHVSKDLELIREAAEGIEIEEKGNDQTRGRPSSKMSYKTLKVRVDQEFYSEIRRAADRLGVEMTTFVRFCIRTGLYLEDLNLYLQRKNKEE
jgi:predicted HicB family RNase H-like nuclease